MRQYQSIVLLYELYLSNDKQDRDRIFLRSQLVEAYQQHFHEFEELLEACAAVDEELIYRLAKSRRDYFKSGVHYERLLTLHHHEAKGTLPGSPKVAKRQRVNVFEEAI